MIKQYLVDNVAQQNLLPEHLFTSIAFEIAITHPQI